MKTRMLVAVCVAFLLAFVAADARAAEPYYKLVDLGPTTFPNAIGNGGYIAGSFIAGSTRNYTAARWSPSGRRTTLPPLSAAYDAQHDAYAVNRDGDAAGSFSESLFGTTRAALWQNGGALDLGVLGGIASAATGINDSGVVIGWWQPTPPAGTGQPTLPNTARAFVWKDGVMLDIGSFAGWGTIPTAVNGRNEFVGWAGITRCETSFLAVRNAGPFLPSYTFMSLGTLGLATCANALNDRTQVVGSYLVPPVYPPHPRPFLWQKGGFTDLGALVEPDGRARARDINNVEQVVGTSRNADPALLPRGWSAVLWRNGATVDLNSLIDPSSTLHLLDATSINDSGRIVGTGIPRTAEQYSLDFHGYLLVPRDKLKSLTLEPSPVLSGKSVTGRVTLDRPAPPGGATVTLASTFPNPNPAALVPQVVIVPAGVATREFTVSTRRQRADKTGKITASYNGSSKTVSLTVKAGG